RDPGRAQLATGGIRTAAPVLERRQAGDPDRDVDLTVAPGAPEGVGDDDGGAAGERGAQRAGRGVGVPREADELPGSTGVGGVDAGVRAHEAVVAAADEHAVLG